MIGMIFAGFKAMSWGVRIASIVAPLLLLGTLYGVWHYKVYQRGYQRALADIAAEDARAIERAKAMRQGWRECRDRGGIWNQSEGKCT